MKTSPTTESFVFLPKKSTVLLICKRLKIRKHDYTQIINSIAFIKVFTMYYALKIVITTLLIVAISEVSKRSSMIGAILASIPLVSVLAMIWLYIDTKDIAKISALSTSVFWLVLPSLVLFILLPILLKLGWSFYLSLSAAIAATVLSYFVMILALNHFGIK